MLKKSKERDILIEGEIKGLARNMVLGKIPRHPQGWPQLRLQATLERMPKLAFPYNQMDDYLNYHYRNFT